MMWKGLNSPRDGSSPDCDRVLSGSLQGAFGIRQTNVPIGSKNFWCELEFGRMGNRTHGHNIKEESRKLHLQ